VIFKPAPPLLLSLDSPINSLFSKARLKLFSYPADETHANSQLGSLNLNSFLFPLRTFFLRISMSGLGMGDGENCVVGHPCMVLLSGPAWPRTLCQVHCQVKYFASTIDCQFSVVGEVCHGLSRSPWTLSCSPSPSDLDWCK